jgi:hypothetical protein
MKLDAGTTRLIWAFHDNDPETSDDISYHGTTTRGTKSLYLQEVPVLENEDINDADTITWDVKTNNVLIPSDKNTYYHCEMFRVKDLGEKHHLIAVSMLPLWIKSCSS